MGDYFIEPTRRPKKGTRVFFSIAISSRRRLEDVFLTYTSDPSKPAFDKSEVPVKLFALGGGHLSRSEAWRMLAGLEKFRAIVLGFAWVPMIRQGSRGGVLQGFPPRHPANTLGTLTM